MTDWFLSVPYMCWSFGRCIFVAAGNSDASLSESEKLKRSLWFQWHNVT